MSKQEFLKAVGNLIEGLTEKEMANLSLTGLYDQILEHVCDHTQERDERDYEDTVEDKNMTYEKQWRAIYCD